jgi:WD40 repeat protein
MRVVVQEARVRVSRAPFRSLNLRGDSMKVSRALLLTASLLYLVLPVALRAANDAPVRDADPAGEITRLGRHQGEVIAIAFAHDGQTAVSYGNDFALRVWDLAKQKQQKEWVPGGHHFALAFSRDDKLLFSGDAGGVLRAWDPAAGEAVGDAMKHGDGIWSVALSTDGKRLVCGCQDGLVRVWNVQTRAKELEVKAQGPVYSVTFSPDGRFALFGGAEKLVRLWDLKNDRLERPLEGHEDAVFRVAFSPDGRRAFSAGGMHPSTGSSDANLCVWDLKTRKLVRKLDVAEGRSPMHCTAFSPDGKRALTGHADGRLTVWDLETGKALATLTGHKEYVSCVAFSPDGRRGLSGGRDNSVRLWRLPAP